ncbi:MAG: transporter [Merdibacter sp.]
MVISMIIFIIREIQAFSPETFVLERYLNFALSLVVGVEFVRMLILKTPGSLVEVVMFAIARQIIISHDSALDTLIGALAVVLMFCCRKYLLKDDNRHWEKNEHHRQPAQMRAVSL